MSKIAAIGMFDGVHSGHRTLLDFLDGEGRRRRLGTMVVTFDGHPLSLVDPGRAPGLLMDAGRRRQALLDAGVDEVVMLHFDDGMRRMDAAGFMSMLHDRYGVSCLVVGYDHRFGHGRAEGFDDYVRIGRVLGMDVLRAPEQEGVSSSAIRAALCGGDIAGANAMLGYRYEISGRVGHGRQLGRTIGFPTANLCAEAGRLVPKRGVYAAEVMVDGDGVWRMAMLNIGHRPTVEGSDCAPVSVEVHIIGFCRDIYGHRIAVRFIGRLRDEMRFGSVEALRQQLEEDRRCVQDNFRSSVNFV